MNSSELVTKKFPNEVAISRHIGKFHLIFRVQVQNQSSMKITTNITGN